MCFKWEEGQGDPNLLPPVTCIPASFYLTSSLLLHIKVLLYYSPFSATSHPFRSPTSYAFLPALLYPSHCLPSLTVMKLFTLFQTKGLLFIWVRLTELAQFPRFLTAESFVKFSMCSYERAGWPGSWDLGFPTGILVSGLGNFSSVLQPGYWDEILWMNSASSCFACSILHVISIPFDNNRAYLKRP